MRKLTKMLAVIVCSVFLLTSMGQTILAAEQTTKVLQVHEDVRKAIEKELQANPDKVKADIEYSKKLSGKGYHTNFAAAVVATYFIPGIGEVALLATGAILVGGVAIIAGTWLWNKIQGWLASNGENDKDGDGVIDVDGRGNWEEVEDEKEILDDENGEIGISIPTEDGDMRKDIVYDKTTGKKIGQIHRKQPGKSARNKIYPDHYERYKPGSTTELDPTMHWWWK